MCRKAKCRQQSKACEETNKSGGNGEERVREWLRDKTAS